LKRQQIDLSALTLFEPIRKLNFIIGIFKWLELANDLMYNKTMELILTIQSILSQQLIYLSVEDYALVFSLH